MRDALESSGRVKTPEGYLHVTAVLARTGIQDYTAAQVGLTDRDPGAIIRVYRDPAEVFAQAAIDSFKLKPVTNDHPEGLVDAASVAKWGVGISLDDVHRDGELLCGTLVIQDAKAVARVEAEKVQLSNGYQAEYIFQDGMTPAGEPYEALQKDIRGNHIALVKNGRCGAVCSIQDCEDCNDGPKPGKGETVKIKLNGVDHEFSDTAGQAVEVLVASAATALRVAKDMEHGKHEAEKERDEAEKEKEKAEGAKDTALALVADTAALDKRAEVRADLIGEARRLFPKVVTADQSNEAIRAAVVTEVTGNKVEDKSAAYVEGVFDSLTAGGGESARFARRNLPDGVRDSGDPAEDKGIAARKKSVADRETDWMSAADREAAGLSVQPAAS